MAEWLRSGWLPPAFALAAAGLLLAAFALLAVRQQRLLRELGRLRGALAEKEALYATDRRRLEELLAAQQAEREELGERLEQARKARHDFRHQLIVLQTLAEAGSRGALEASLAELSAADTDDPLTLCDNALVDSLARRYLRQAEQAGVELDVVLDVDRDFFVQPLDIGVLFGNLFENAVTAAGAAPPGSRYIRIRTASRPECFVLVVGNTFGGTLRGQSDTFLSTKTDHSGIGLASIRSAARRYCGDAVFSVEDGLFRSSVILFRPGEPTVG